MHENPDDFDVSMIPMILSVVAPEKTRAFLGGTLF